tara:strand:- start:527 stop:652 length:126 start_codon:yes stop_codon:yes gene_type:complete
MHLLIYQLQHLLFQFQLEEVELEIAAHVVVEVKEILLRFQV